MQIFRKLSIDWPFNQEINCKKLLLILSEYLDGELDASLCREIEKHLGDCRDCKVSVDTFKKTIVILKPCCEGEMPQEVHFRLHNFLKEKCQGEVNRSGFDWMTG